MDKDRKQGRPATFLLPANGFGLADTLQCGQTFSWQADGTGFCGVAGRRAARVQLCGGSLSIAQLAGPRQDAEAFWRRYFSLDVDYQALTACLCRDEQLAGSIAVAPGMRLLRQPFFDTLLSFIISQNNNIPRIRAITGRLRETFGGELAPGIHAFPLPERLAAASGAELDSLRAGFRARYLVDAAEKVAGGMIHSDALATMDDDEARQALMQITGVGPKVADCVLLHALGRLRVVPMDVWMKRTMARYYPGGMPACAEGWEGVAQLYLFHAARTRPPEPTGAG